MERSHSSATSVSLLARVGGQDRDPAAWREFVDRYGRRIYEWCVSRRLQPADAEDVTQEVLLKLATRLQTFEYDNRLTFRGWLRRVTTNAVTDFFRERKTDGRGRQLTNGLERLEQEEAREDLSMRLGEAFDLELLDVAKARVRARVDRNRWLAWQLLAVERWTGEAVAAELDMTARNVYSSRFHVQKMITEETERLKAESNSLFSQDGQP